MIEKEWALIFGILFNAIIDHIKRSMEPNVMLTILGQELTIMFRYNDTTSSRDDDIISLLEKFFQSLRLNLTKGCLTFFCKKISNGHADFLLDDLIHIHETTIQVWGDGTLTNSHKAQ